MPSKLTIAKAAINGAVAVTVSKVVNDIIANNLSEPESQREELEMKAGSALIGLAVVGRFSDSINTTVDNVAAFVEGVKESRKDAANQEVPQQ